MPVYADFQHYLWYTKGMENKRISIDELNNLSKETISLLYLQTFEMLQNLQAQNASLIAQVEDLKQQMATLAYFLITQLIYLFRIFLV